MVRKNMLLLGSLTFAFILLIIVIVSASIKQKTIADFEASTFFKKQILKNKDTWSLRTGGINNSYSFKDPDNLYDSFGVEMTTINKNIVSISILWHGMSTNQPAEITPKREEQLRDLASFWGVKEQAKQIIDYVKSQQFIHYRGGSNTAPRTTLGQITIYCGTTGSTLWVGWM